MRFGSIEGSREITEEVHQRAQALVSLLENGRLKIFTHGPNSVVFDWSDGENNVYLTVEKDRLSILTSTPERITGRS